MLLNILGINEVWIIEYSVYMLTCQSAILIQCLELKCDVIAAVTRIRGWPEVSDVWWAITTVSLTRSFMPFPSLYFIYEFSLIRWGLEEHTREMEHIIR